ncbi:FAD-dependent oxidoreductase [candidate division KSB1 bacterium]|nr:FAD-dependent oxidoreductase [candidate division KSB1 bacterium]
MKRLQSIEDFKALQGRLIASYDSAHPTIIIPAGTCGQASGANDLIRITKRELLEKALTDRIHLRITGCHGFCQAEPSVLIEPGRIFYPKLDIESMRQVVAAVANNAIRDDLLYTSEETGERIAKQDDIPFFKHQVRSILSRNEKLDPIRIFNYMTSGGYSAMTRVFESRDPRWVIEEVKASGLRGRGGAGFPTGLKWEMLAQQPSGKGKFLVCNADEGDPGAYMDRSLLEGNPHSIIEGMIIGAYGTGATDGVIYVRNEYPLAIKHLVIALRQARELGLLGENIFSTSFSFDIKLVRGAGAFVCGEETALIRSIEGKMGEPRQRPPFPIERGINGQPTAINNVETWANIPIIFEKSAAKFAKIGTENNTGTKIFSLVGKIKNTGLVEVPMGMTIDKIINEIGGGPVGDAKIKAVQTGGPSGGCIPTAMFHLPIDYDHLREAGSIMGSGGMIVMDENTCMVDVAKYFMHFLMDESCGKCFTCRKGIQRMHEILEDVSNGKNSLSRLNLLEELANVVKDTSMCGLGQSAPNPVLSTLKYFRKEYERHIFNKRCDAFVCKNIVGAPCQSACPLGTEAWRYIAHIAQGEYEQAYIAIREFNPFPSVCARLCNSPCESKCKSGTLGGNPIAIRALKRFITDQIDPSIYKPIPINGADKPAPEVAIIGSGPAGLTAAHYLSLAGYRSTVFEASASPGGMLVACIPEYRMPRNVLQKEIEAITSDKNVSVKCNQMLGREFSLDELFDRGYQAVFLAMGAHKSRRLNIEGENLLGVFPAIEFLKQYNLNGKSLAKGNVGVVGGGDSAIDAARVALRQEGVESVTILYRRTQKEMPALPHEVAEAIHEGVTLQVLTSPVKILSKKGKLIGVQCIRNRLGKIDASGRRNPEPIPESEHEIHLDTLIVTIGDVPEVDYISSMGIEVDQWGTLCVDEDTLCTNRSGVFAGGDVVTGPNTIVEAIAAGKKAAVMIDRFLRNQDLKQPAEIRLPQKYVKAVEVDDAELETGNRVMPPTLPLDVRQRSFSEVEQTLSVEEATREARRCLRCDLDFAQPDA